MVFYHGTDSGRKKEILETGLEPQKMGDYPWLEVLKKIIFLTSDKRHAAEYAKQIAKIRKSEPLLLSVDIPEEAMNAFLSNPEAKKCDEHHYSQTILPEWISEIKKVSKISAKQTRLLYKQALMIRTGTTLRPWMATTDEEKGKYLTAALHRSVSPQEVEWFKKRPEAVPIEDEEEPPFSYLNAKQAQVMYKLSKIVNLGTVGVDSGTLWISDPCYVMGDNPHKAGKDWEDIVDKLTGSNATQWNFKNGVKGMGLAVATGGDGGFPVKGYVDSDGMLKSIIIKGLTAKDPGKVKEVTEEITSKQAQLMHKLSGAEEAHLLYKLAWRNALENDASKVYELQSDFNPFSLYSSKNHTLVTKATEEMKGVIKHYLESWYDWMNKYQDLGAGDTASAEAAREYFKKIEEIGWEDVLENVKPVTGKTAQLLYKAASIKKLKKKHGITKTEDGVGFSPTEKKWFGWSHRGFAGFGVGDKTKKGDAGYIPSKGTWTAKTLDDAKQMAKDFAEGVS